MSSSFLKAESISRALLLIPYLWLAIGIIWMPQGNKPLVALVLVAAIIHMFTYGLSQVKYNFKNNIWLCIVLFSGIFTAISYVTYGASSQELRGLLVTTVFLCLLPQKQPLNARLAQYLLFGAALACFTLSCWYFFIDPTNRMFWPTNPIPLATHQGLVSMLSIGALLTRFKNKITWLLILSAIISGFSLLLTQSRGAILGVVILYILIGLTLLYQNRINIKIIILSLILCFGAVFFSKEALVDRYDQTWGEVSQIERGDLDSSIGLRLQMYQAGLELFASSPMLGHGEFTREYAEENLTGYTPTGYHFISQAHLHNNYIDKLARSGIIGLSIFLFFIFYPVYLGLRKYPDLFWLFSLPSIHYAVASITDSPFRNGDTLVVYMIVTGTLVHYAKIKYKEKL
ncbi:O-antigen ligase family protein [Vibrio atlanticus]|uniref:O-antigen ligase family protein n=1 Tax=Vibrio atlanticus TaxID=693153 RepID=A0ABV4KPB2_9VIBR